ncbi:hypothetical protein ACFQE7_39925 [Nonomuraea ferruginea]|uniref:hypothetical protein n=1 Tax=Nonomuraea ferruginea TaxID=46174 RepID=UPI00361C4A11
MPYRDAPPRQQPELRRARRAQRVLRVVHPRGAQELPDLRRGAAAQDGVAADVVHGAVLLAVGDDPLQPVLQQERAAEPGREVVDDPLKIRHGRPLIRTFHHLLEALLQVFPTTER